jgi:hypothetical protein
MSYQLNRTDGTILTNLIDGQIDTDSTNLTLVGRNYTGYGEAFNENFIRLLENFSSTAAPSNPLSGQLWWDTTEERLKVYDGTTWKASGGPYVQDSRPQMVAGDLWIDNLNNKVYAYDGTDTILMGPSYTASQGVSGFEIVDIIDSTSRSRTVAKLFVSGNLTAIVSDIEFTPLYSERITSLVTTDNPDGTIFPGFNIVDKDNFKFRGIANSANALVTANGTIRTADSFLPSDNNGTTIGTLTIQNQGGLTIGLSQNNVQKVVQDRFYIENQLRDHDLSLRVRSSQFESVIVDAVYVDAGTARVGIFTTDRLPEYTLDVEGDLRVTGNLLIEGDTSLIEVSTLRVEDKHIELAALDDSSIGDDNIIDGAGIIVRSTTSDKTLTWIDATDSWTSNQNIDLSSNSLTYKVNGSVKLSNDSLTNILYAPDLVEIGTLDYLNVQNLSIGDIANGIGSNEIRNTGSNLLLSSTNSLKLITGVTTPDEGTITIDTNQLIYGVTTPISARVAAASGGSLTEDTDDSVATKEYVDAETLNAPIVFSMDISGLGTGTALQNAVSSYLNDLYPAIPGNNGKIARIHCTSYSGATVSGIVVDVRDNTDDDNGEVLVLSKTQVDAGQTLNESVVQDVSASNTASGSVTLSPIRSLMVFISNGGGWIHSSTTAYP